MAKEGRVGRKCSEGLRQKGDGRRGLGVRKSGGSSRNWLGVFWQKRRTGVGRLSGKSVEDF